MIKSVGNIIIKLKLLSISMGHETEDVPKFERIKISFKCFLKFNQVHLLCLI